MTTSEKLRVAALCVIVAFAACEPDEAARRGFCVRAKDRMEVYEECAKHDFDCAYGVRLGQTDWSRYQCEALLGRL